MGSGEILEERRAVGFHGNVPSRIIVIPSGASGIPVCRVFPEAGSLCFGEPEQSGYPGRSSHVQEDVGAEEMGVKGVDDVGMRRDVHRRRFGVIHGGISVLVEAVGIPVGNDELIVLIRLEGQLEIRIRPRIADGNLFAGSIVRETGHIRAALEKTDVGEKPELVPDDRAAEAEARLDFIIEAADLTLEGRSFRVVRLEVLPPVKQIHFAVEFITAGFADDVDDSSSDLAVFGRQSAALDRDFFGDVQAEVIGQHADRRVRDVDAVDGIGIVPDRRAVGRACRHSGRHVEQRVEVPGRRNIRHEIRVESRRLGRALPVDSRGEADDDDFLADRGFGHIDIDGRRNARIHNDVFPDRRVESRDFAFDLVCSGIQ